MNADALKVLNDIIEEDKAECLQAAMNAAWQSTWKSKPKKTTMTKKIKFKGHSDDIFGYAVNGKFVDEQGNGARKIPLVYEVRSGDDGLRVVGMYAVTSGTWMIGVEGIDRDEDIMPDWTGVMTFEGYSTILEFEVPDDATITKVNSYPLRIQK